MKRKVLIVYALLLLIGFLALPRPARAHETITVGDYAVEYGWVNEPAIAGQPNAVAIHISPKDGSTSDQSGGIDVSGLKVEAIYGGQTKILVLQPLGEGNPNQFIAPMTPTRAGIYTIHLSGNVASTTFNTDVQPEEVHPEDLVQFPGLDQAQGGSQATGSTSQAGWVSIAGLIFGVLGTILGLIALARRPLKS